jgi:hypothetical protein
MNGKKGGQRSAIARVVEFEGNSGANLEDAVTEALEYANANPDEKVRLTFNRVKLEIAVRSVSGERFEDAVHRIEGQYQAASRNAAPSEIIDLTLTADAEITPSRGDQLSR